MIKNVGNFLSIVDELYPKSKSAFFRGQSSSDFDVSSSLFRLIKKCGVDTDVSGLFSIKLFEKFKEKFPAYPESSFLKNYSTNEIDILMTAQHYGMPTRLIDWTANPLVALYFAAENRNYSKYMSVFILKESQENPLNILSGTYFNELTVADKEIYGELNSCLLELLRSFEQGNIINNFNYDQFIGYAYKKISEIKRIPTKVTSARNVFNLLKEHEKDGKSAADIANDVAEKLEFSLRKISKESDNSLREFFIETQSRFTKIFANYIGGLAGMDLYGSGNLVVEPLPLNSRIKNQQGFFLCSKKCHAPEFKAKEFVLRKNLVRSKSDINDGMANSSIIRIDIETKYSEKIKKELARYGIKKSFVYPELACFSEEIKEDTLNDWCAD